MSEALGDALAKFSARDPADLAAAQARWDRHQAERRAALLESRLGARGVPRDAAVRLPVRSRSVPGTAPLLGALAALRWRHERRLPSGEAPGLVVVLQGPPGCGKTVAGAWIVARWPRAALFVPSDDLAAVPDSDWSDHAEVRERWRRVELLVIDDVGAERDGRARERVASRTGPLLLSRYNDGLATLVTTNRDARSFCDTYFATDESPGGGNARLASRLREAQQDRGCPYWLRYGDARSFRGSEGEKALADLAKIEARDLLG